MLTHLSSLEAEELDLGEFDTPSIPRFTSHHGSIRHTGSTDFVHHDGTTLSVPRAPACVWCCRLMGWSIFGFAALNLPTCHWLGCSRAWNPRGSASSTALVDEPGSDGQKHRELRLQTLCPRHSMKSSGAAATQQGGR